MPNWCNGFVKVEGKIKNVENFCKLFLFEDNRINKDSKYFARSFIHEKWKDFKKEHLDIHPAIERIEPKNAKRLAEFNVNFAWSCWSCIFEGYPNGKECVTLDWACKKYNVTVEIETEETGIGFEEKISGDKKGISYEEEKMREYKCKCGNTQAIPSSYELENEECYECEEVGNFNVI